MDGRTDGGLELESRALQWGPTLFLLFTANGDYFLALELARLQTEKKRNWTKVKSFSPPRCVLCCCRQCVIKGVSAGDNAWLYSIKILRTTMAMAIHQKSTPLGVKIVVHRKGRPDERCAIVQPEQSTYTAHDDPFGVIVFQSVWRFQFWRFVRGRVRW